MYMDAKKYSEKIYSIDALRIIAAFFVVAIHFSFQGVIGEIVWINSYFAVPFFYIVSGFFIKVKKNEKIENVIKRRMKHICKLFLYTAFVYVLINIFYFLIYKKMDAYNWIISQCSPEKMFDFVIFNVWPFVIGGAIWFLQAMIYSYFAILLLIKTKLIKFEIYIIIGLLALNAILGEFSTLLHVPTVMASWITRALPYMLLGHYLSNNIDKIRKIKKSYLYAVILISIIMCLMEYYILEYYSVLGYTGHYQGNTVLALILVIFFIQNPLMMKDSVLYKLGKKYSLSIYLIHQPLGSMIEPHLGKLTIISPIIIFVSSLFVAYGCDVIKNKYVMKKSAK